MDSSNASSFIRLVRACQSVMSPVLWLESIAPNCMFVRLSCPTFMLPNNRYWFSRGENES